MKCKLQQLVDGSTNDKHSTITFIYCGVQCSLLISRQWGFFPFHSLVKNNTEIYVSGTVLEYRSGWRNASVNLWMLTIYKRPA